MPIVINRPQYVAPTIKRESTQDNTLGNFGQALGSAVNTLGEIITQSSSEATKATVSRELSQLNLETNMKLGELQRSGATDIESQISTFQSNKIAEIEKRNTNTPFFQSMWKDNLWKVTDNLKLKAQEAQLNSDSIIEANNTQISLQTDLANIKMDPSQFSMVVDNIFNTLNSTKLMSTQQRLATKAKYFNAAAIEALKGDIDKYGVEDAMVMLKQGKYTYTDQWGDKDDQKTTYSLYNEHSKAFSPEAITAIQVAKSKSFDQLLAYGDLDSLINTRDNWDKLYGSKDTGYSVKGFGSIWDSKTKADNYTKLNKAIKSKKITVQDQMEAIKLDLITKGLQGDRDATQRMLDLQANGDKSYNKVLAHINTFTPMVAKTNQEILGDIEQDIKNLSNVDTSSPATETDLSGMTKAMELKSNIIQKLQYLNNQGKLSEEDMNKYTQLVSMYRDEDWNTINTAIQGLEDFRSAPIFNDLNFFTPLTMKWSFIKDGLKATKTQLDIANKRNGIIRSRETLNASIKSLGTAASTQIMNTLLDNNLSSEDKIRNIQDITFRYKKAITLTAFPQLKVETPNGPDVAKIGDKIMINGFAWTLDGFQKDGITPQLSRVIK